LQQFQLFRWAGNIRQLGKAIEYGMTICRKETLGWKDVEGYLILHPNNVPDQTDIYSMDYTAFKAYLQKSNDEVESSYLRHYLEQNHYNIPNTAEAMKLPHRQQLNQWMKRLKIDLHEKR
jgi:DNA-binding NtrC family response regulator